MNSNNSFSFPTLAYGVYFLRAELPGCTSDLVRIEITQANPVANVVMTFSGKSMLGINENQAMIESLSIFPNPVTDQLTLTIVSKKDAAVQIGLSDLSGRLVISESWPLSYGGNTLHLNTGSLQPGLFILKITSPDGTNLIRKVIKTE